MPWSGRAWRDFAFTTLSGLLSLLPFAILGLPWAVFVPIELGPVLACAFIPIGIVILLGPRFSTMRRACFFEMLGVEIPAPPAASRAAAATAGRPPSTWSALRDHFKSPRTWRQACYHLVAGPAINLLGVLSALLWLFALGFLISPVVTAAEGVPWINGDLGVTTTVLLVIIIIGVMYLAPRLVMASVRIDTKLATSLLGPSRAERLAVRVVNLTESRAAVVDAADAERRRIERDLHDGTQQRLVSLAMNLGLARATLSDLPEPAGEALREAHEEAKEALAELRDLVRGLHPVVLEDRGLDAALSGIAARSPVPVRLAVDVPSRVSPTVEAVAYFIVSEALANVAKHAQASAAQVTVEQEDGLLRLTVRDDGVGGADPARGTGLTGLAQRAASVDGSFAITSPPGGPTVIRADLSCEL